MDTQLQKADGTSVFSVHMTYVCPFFTIMAYNSPPYHSNYGMMISVWHIKVLKVGIYFILSSEINAYLQ